MNLKLAFPLGALALAGWLSGCATPAPTVPKVAYPVTYQINVGNTEVSAPAGPQNLNVNATQQVTVQPGATLYYQVISPVAVTMYIYADGDGGSHALLGQMQGTSFTSSILPSTSSLEFAFAVAQANSSGTLQFTISDQPIAPAVTP
jgi:hypothetical protein